VLTGVLWLLAGAALVAVLGGACIAFITAFSDPEGRIRVTEPDDGAVVTTPQVLIRGTSSPDWAGVYLVLGEGRRQLVHVDEDGGWAYQATLEPGENRFKFHLDSHYGQSDAITITYQPP
jgi:hypothetical protein